MAVLIGLQYRYHLIESIPVKVRIERIQVSFFEFGRQAERATLWTRHGHLDRIDDLAGREEQQGRERSRTQFSEMRPAAA